MSDRPTFDETYPRYEFAELVRLGIAIGRTVQRWVESERTMGTFRKAATVAAVTVLVASAIMPVLADDGTTHAKLTQPAGSQPMEFTPTSRGDRSVVVLSEADLDKVAAGAKFFLRPHYQIDNALASSYQTGGGTNDGSQLLK